MAEFPLLRRQSMALSDAVAANEVQEARRNLLRTKSSAPAFEPFPTLRERALSSRTNTADRHTRIPEPSLSDKLKSILSDDRYTSILKCSIAYFLASLIVYTPVGLIFGHSDSKHTVATVAVYFHPARTAGSMAESIMFVLVSLAYSFTMAIGSMLVSVLCNRWDIRAVGFAIDLVFFCAFGIGFAAFYKVRVNKPTFNTACSLSFIFLVSVLTKEGSVQEGVFSFKQLFQQFGFVCTGSLISLLICLTCWPKSAATELRKTFIKSIKIQSEVFAYIVDHFISGGDIDTEEYAELVQSLNSTFKRIDNLLSDTRYELLITGRLSEFEILEKIVRSNHLLACLHQGLGSSARTQRYLLCDEYDFSADRTNSEARSDSASISDAGSIVSLNSLGRHFGVAGKHIHQSLGYSSSVPPTQGSTGYLFRLFLDYLGPPLIDFASSVQVACSFDDFAKRKSEELVEATKLYSSQREEALRDIYNLEAFKNPAAEADSVEEGVVATCGNFTYIIEDIGQELSVFLELLDEYDTLRGTEVGENYSWLKSLEGLKLWTKPLLVHEDTDQSFRYQDTSNSAHAKSKYEKPSMFLRIWRSVRLLRRADVKFGFKVGLGALLFAIPAFTDSLRPVFGRWRGEWGLITYAIIMSKSAGGTTMTMPIRIMGTFTGAAVAFLVWMISGGSAVVLSLTGWALSLVCFWMILHWKSKNMLGRFILLTYNLTVLYSYSLSVHDDEDDDDEGGSNPLVLEIAVHRFLSVCMGVIWALIITYCIFPNSARRKLKDGLAKLWLQMGLIWKADALTTLPRGEFTGVRGEFSIRRSMMELKLLLSQAPSEFRMKGPFPIAEYSNLVNYTERIMDIYASISVLITKYPKPTSSEIEIMDVTTGERREICSRIFLLFYLASSAMKLGYPLPEKLPSTEHAIDRMLVKLQECRAENNADEEDFVLFYSYVLATINITEELAKMAMQIQHLFGIIEDEIYDI